MAIEKAKADIVETERTITRCEALIPDTDSFSSEYTSAAVDAGTAIVETLKALVDSAPQHIIDVASFCHDTVHMFIQERDGLDFNNDPNFEKKIDDDPLMRDEVARQTEVLRELTTEPDLNRFFLNRLRNQARNGGISNIGLSA
jgi:uncharacterized protein YjaG (DUF416 family)